MPIRRENFTLLAHNAVAYWEDGKKEQALLSALQAGAYADAVRKNLLNRFIAMLGVRSSVRIPAWNFGMLKGLQLIIPGLAVLAVLLSLSTKVMTDSELSKYFSRNNEIKYFQQVQFRTGGETVDDMVVGRIIDLPADPEDVNMLYHTTGEVRSHARAFGRFRRLGRAETAADGSSDRIHAGSGLVSRPDGQRRNGLCPFRISEKRNWP